MPTSMPSRSTGTRKRLLPSQYLPLSKVCETTSPPIGVAEVTRAMLPEGFE